MSSTFDRLVHWVRQIWTAQPDPFGPTEVLEAVKADATLIYRLRRWPQLPTSRMSTDIARTLSIMSTRPVNRRWLLNNSNLSELELDSILQRLVEQGAVEVTDARNFGPHAQSA